jgi:transcriptional regulator with XRE-family HTH domain
MAQAQPVLSDAFSQVIKKHREKRKLSRAKLAELSGLHQTYIGLLERGERSPNLDTAKAIANALRLSLGKIVTEAEQIQKRR